MNLRKLRWALLLYIAFDLFFGGKCGGFFDLDLAAAAQFTTVSGTVVDPNGLPYANGTISATLNTSASPTLGGFPYQPPTQPVGLNAAGVFVMQLADNTVLLPAATTWTFQVCSAAGTVQPAGGNGPICFTVTGLTISGASQDISTQLQAAASSLVLGAVASSTQVGIGGGIFGIDWIPNGGVTPALVVVSNVNEVDCWQIVHKYTQLVGHFSYDITTTYGAATHYSEGIYSARTGALIAQTGVRDGTILGVQTVTISPAVSLKPDVYWLCATSESASGRNYGLSVGVSLGAGTLWFNNTIANRQVKYSIASSGGALPANLSSGTFSAQTTNFPPVAFIEP